jgi:hypothetical protein
MNKIVLPLLLLFCLCPPMNQSVAETLDVRLRILQKGSEETVITRENLIKIKQFIIQSSQRETYNNLYNNNPSYHTQKFRFYLNPDAGSNNSDCDLNKSDFNSLTIRNSSDRNQYRTVEFLDKTFIYVTTSWPTEDLTILQIRRFVKDAMEDILAELSKKMPLKTNTGSGK